MSNLVKPSSPPFLFTYWNPFAKDSNLVGSWFDYVRDVSLAKYAADSVGQYLQQASADQISAIDSVGRRICGALYSGFSELQAELEKVTKELQGVNQRLDLVLDEARTSNLLQENMAELLRIPDSQKQRQHHIEMALKFLKNALKDQDLYQDALRELLEAEKLMHADYFVLHRIGMIYLYVPALGNLEKALDYFNRAGKYASVESHPDAARLSNILNKKVNKRFAEQAEPSSADVSALAAESFLQAGTSLYALGRFEEAAKMAEKAANCQPAEAKYHFFMAKYLTRSGNPDAAVPQLQKATELVPEMALAAVGDLDLNKAQPILDLLNRLDAEVNAQLQRGVEILKGWPQGDHRHADVLRWITDAQSSLEKGNYSQKRLLAVKLKEHEGNLSFAPKLAQIAAFGVEFDKAQAQQLLCENNPDHVREIWTDRRKRNSILDAQLKEIAVKPQPDFLELVLLATAAKACFLAAGTIRWKADAADHSDSITIDTDGNVYGGYLEHGLHSKVWALNGSNGTKLWEFKTEYPGRGTTHPRISIGGDGTIYVVTAMRLFAFDGETKNQLWKVEADEDDWSFAENYPAIGVDGTVYANIREKICAFHGQTGKKLWKFEADHFLCKSSPAIGTDGTIYTSGFMKVFALNGQTGEKLWVFETEILGDFSSPAIGVDGIVYIGTKNIVYALGGQTGEKLWEFKAKDEIETSLIVGQNGTVYVGTEDDKLYALDGHAGKKLWCSAGGSSPVVGDDGTVYEADYRTLWALDGQTGEKLWEFKLQSKEQVLSDPVIGPDGTIYFYCTKDLGSSDVEQIYAISTASGGLADSLWPIHGQNAQRTGCAARLYDKPAVSKEQKNKIKRLMAEARAAVAIENAKWFRKKDFTRARELYTQAAALGSKEAAQRLKSLPM